MKEKERSKNQKCLDGELEVFFQASLVSYMASRTLKGDHQADERGHGVESAVSKQALLIYTLPGQDKQ